MLWGRKGLELGSQNGSARVHLGITKMGTTYDWGKDVYFQSKLEAIHFLALEWVLL